MVLSRAGDAGRGLQRGVVVFGALALVAGLMAPADAYQRPGRTERVSVSADGAEGDGFSLWPAISADGRFVAFHSWATNLVLGDTNNTHDLFVRDQATGTIERVSVASDGTQANAGSISPSLSSDGRYVAFSSAATNLVPGYTRPDWDVYVHDRETGVTEIVTVSSDGVQANVFASGGSISADGRFVAFNSRASNLVAGDTNGDWDIFVHDRQTRTTERVSVASDGAQANGPSWYPEISADGRYVAFESFATNLVPGGSGTMDSYVHDRQTGTTERVSVASDGAVANHASYRPVLSGDGRYVAFESLASNLVPGDTNDKRDVFVRDRQTETTERVSVTSDGAEGNTQYSFPAISADGRYVTFYSSAYVPPGGSLEWGDVFVHDRQTGVTERVSVASDGARGNNNSAFAAISDDGRHVAFDSWASNLVPGDTNAGLDVFVRDRGPATGVGSLATQRAGDEVTVSGWAAFSGGVVVSAEDSEDDGTGAARELGAEITGASITYRPELGDVLLRIDLASLSGWVGTCLGVGSLCYGAGPGAGAPGVLYRWVFTVGGIDYEVRALRAAATVVPPAAPYFALYECAPTCTEAARLSGGIGTAGKDVRVAVPLEALGAQEGTQLSRIRASTALGEAALGVLEALDELDLADAVIPTSRVELGFAPPSAPQADVSFSELAELVEGRFSGSLDVSSLPPGAPHRVWARACLGQVCGAHSVVVDP